VSTIPILLIVDDVEANRDTMQAILGPDDYRLVEAPDGPTALQLARDLPPDLVLLDVMMPGMDGFEVCRRLRADPRHAEVPIVLVTALDDDASRLTGFESGADDFVTKPFNRAELRARVRSITRLNRYRRITEMQERLMRAHRLENLGMLTSGIAHDFNNALAPILMAGTLLREQVSEPGGRRLLAIIEQSSTRGAALVRQMLAFARGIAGERQRVQVGEVLREVIDIAATTFPKSIRIESQLPGDLWPVLANPTQLNQVFMNLAINARDAMAQGGVLAITATNCVLDAAAAAAIPDGRPGRFIRMEVRDTGTGIPPDVLERIWEPFFTTKESDKGTGLGLATVRGIVRQDEGFAVVQTTSGAVPGHGTSFIVYWPALLMEHDPGEEGGAPVEPAKRGAGELILVVDDEESVRDVCAEVLTRQGYRVVTANDGAEGIVAFAQRATEVRLLLTDNDMPVLSGAAMIVAVRGLNPALPVVIISGLNSLGKGPPVPPATARLAKPFTAEALSLVVQRTLDMNRPG
jgi:CheY-like chemotaxis protein